MTLTTSATGAVAEVRHRRRFDQALFLERAQVLIKPRIARVVFQVVGERDSVPAGALEQVHLGTTQVIDAAAISNLLALAAVRQREVMFATLAEIVARSWRDTIRQRRDSQVAIYGVRAFWRPLRRLFE